jgi:hypothetical protein
MSCAPRSIGSFSRCALPFVIALTAAPAVAYSQSSACHAIRSGETATQAARRITGDRLDAYQPWFQIMDRSSRFVPKSQYNRVLPGWRACIVKEATASSGRVVAASQRETLEAPIVPAATAPPATAEALQPIGGAGLMLERFANALRPIDGVHLMVVWFAFAVIVPFSAWKILDNYVSQRNAKLIVMKHFARRFVSEFERPLIQQPAEHPVRSLVRLSPVRARLDILLAPGDGRRYPNLSDHKKNVEYDVVRILRALADDSFVRDPLYTQAGWVVVPFRFKVSRKHRGVA